MIYSLVGELPRHIYCFVDSSFTHTWPNGFIPCVWFGLVSYPGRTWGCTVMLESGSIYRNVPAHAIAFSQFPAERWAAGYTFAKAHELVVLGKGILFGAAAVAIVVWS